MKVFSDIRGKNQEKEGFRQNHLHYLHIGLNRRRQLVRLPYSKHLAFLPGTKARTCFLSIRFPPSSFRYCSFGGCQSAWNGHRRAAVLPPAAISGCTSGERRICAPVLPAHAPGIGAIPPGAFARPMAISGDVSPGIEPDLWRVSRQTPGSIAGHDRTMFRHRRTMFAEAGWTAEMICGNRSSVIRVSSEGECTTW